MYLCPGIAGGELRRVGTGSGRASSSVSISDCLSSWWPQRDSNPCLRSANQGRLRGEGVVRRPHELTPIALCQLDRGPQPLLRVQKPSHAH